MHQFLDPDILFLQDYRSNPEEFPEFFPSGVFEAVWWAAVTMTTVGYVPTVTLTNVGCNGRLSMSFESNLKHLFE